jgi:hypothetical protein
MNAAAEIPQMPALPSDMPVLPIAKIEPAVEFTRFCYECEVEYTFSADRVCANGLLGECLRCGATRLAPFTRTNSEVK